MSKALQLSEPLFFHLLVRGLYLMIAKVTSNAKIPLFWKVVRRSGENREVSDLYVP